MTTAVEESTRRAPRLFRLARRTATVLAWLLMAAAVVGWWIYLRPPVLGGTTSFVIVNGESMEPTYSTGDLVVVREQPHYEIGDVVAFHSTPGDEEGALVIHRIVEVRDDGHLVVQGDNNDWVDPWTPSPDDVAGTPLFELAGFGTVLYTLAGSPPLLGAVFGGVVTFLVMIGGKRDRSPRKRVRRPGFAGASALVAIGVLSALTMGSAATLALDGAVLQTFDVPASIPVQP